MKRALIFLGLAPTCVGIISWLCIPPGPNALSQSISELTAAVLVFITLLTSACAGLVDGYLSRKLPMPWPAFASTIAGATAAPLLVCGLSLLTFGGLPPHWVFAVFAVCGAAVAVVCSLLSHFCGRRSPESSGEVAAGSRMLRTGVFLLAAPALMAVVTVLLPFIKAGGTETIRFVAIFALAVFVFTFVVSVFACAVDTWLARRLSVLPRAGLTAAGGAFAAGGLALPMGPGWMFAAVSCGVLAGICSLLANGLQRVRLQRVQGYAVALQARYGW